MKCVLKNKKKKCVKKREENPYRCERTPLTTAVPRVAQMLTFLFFCEQGSAEQFSYSRNCKKQIQKTPVRIILSLSQLFSIAKTSGF